MLICDSLHTSQELKSTSRSTNRSIGRSTNKSLSENASRSLRSTKNKTNSC